MKTLLRLLPVFLACLLVLALGATFIGMAMAFPQSRALPAGLTCMAVAMLGSMLILILSQFDQRLQVLEQRFPQTETPGKDDK